MASILLPVSRGSLLQRAYASLAEVDPTLPSPDFVSPSWKSVQVSVDVDVCPFRSYLRSQHRSLLLLSATPSRSHFIVPHPPRSLLVSPFCHLRCSSRLLLFSFRSPDCVRFPSSWRGIFVHTAHHPELTAVWTRACCAADDSVEQRCDCSVGRLDEPDVVRLCRRGESRIDSSAAPSCEPSTSALCTL